MGFLCLPWRRLRICWIFVLVGLLYLAGSGCRRTSMPPSSDLFTATPTTQPSVTHTLEATPTPSPSATADPGATPTPPLNLRFGFGVSQRFGDINSYDVSQLHAGWYSNWDISPDPPRPAGLEYVQMIRVGRNCQGPSRKALIEAVQAQPGSLWIIGNEPERRALASRSKVDNYADRPPNEYAAIYDDLYHLIKQLDPTAQVAIGGVVQPSPLRLRWLEMVLAEYKALTGEKMPVDVWNIHVQILREKRDFPGCEDCWGADIPQGIDDVTEGLLLEIKDNANIEIFKRFIWDFRRWMKAQGEQNKPLMISEYGILMPSEYLGETVEAGDQVVLQFMLDSFDFLLYTRDPEIGYPQDDYRLVQRWLWYSLNEPPYHFNEDYQAWIGFNGSLFDWRNPEWPGTLTKFGEAFAKYTAALLPPQR